MIGKRKCFAGANNFAALCLHIGAIKEPFCIYTWKRMQPQTAINSAAKVSKVLGAGYEKRAPESKIHSRTEREPRCLPPDKWKAFFNTLIACVGESNNNRFFSFWVCDLARLPAFPYTSCALWRVYVKSVFGPKGVGRCARFESTSLLKRSRPAQWKKINSVAAKSCASSGSHTISIFAQGVTLKLLSLLSWSGDVAWRHERTIEIFSHPLNFASRFIDKFDATKFLFVG